MRPIGIIPSPIKGERKIGFEGRYRHEGCSSKHDDK